MDSKQLMVGNYVLDREDRSDDTVYKVCRTYDEDFYIWNEGGDVEYFSCKTVGSQDDYYEIKPFGIELSKKWFKKLGFEIDEDNNINYYTINDVIESNSYPERQDFIVMYDSGQHYFQCDSFEIPLDHVHELQNLYFVLTRGKQLKIKEDE